MAQYTIDEVRQHKFPHDMWIVYSGKVYDITRFFDDHPGGTETLVDNAGTDATSVRHTVRRSEGSVALVTDSLRCAVLCLCVAPRSQPGVR